MKLAVKYLVNIFHYGQQQLASKLSELEDWQCDSKNRFQMCPTLLLSYIAEQQSQSELSPNLLYTFILMLHIF